LTWTLAAFGNYILANFRDENIATAAGGVLSVWDGNPAHVATYPATLITDSPAGVYATFVTPEKFAVALGAVDPNHVLTGTEPDPRLVWWASQATTDTWTPDALNSAGSFSLASAGSLMAAAAFRGQSLLWTTRDLWSMQYLGQPLIYGFQQLGVECGLFSSHAYVVASNAVFWMGPGRFYRFDGFISPLQCDVADYVFSNINTDFQWKTWALHNPQFNEVTWFYVSKTAPTNATTGVVEVDSYVTYNYTENHWVFGTLSRTCGVAAQVPGLVPVMASPEGVLYQHETGNTRGGLYAHAESGPIELAPGDQIMRIQQIVPDDKTVGDVRITIYASLFPDDAEISTGAITISATHKPTSVRMVGRQVRVGVTEATASSWRVGTIRLGVIPSGRR
jgi:hypothetical protein